MDVAKFNAQHGNTLTVKESANFHDRFLIIDKSILIHVGASLNYLGKKCFAFSSLDKSNIPDIRTTEGVIQMLYVETVFPSTLDLLKRLQSLPELSNVRLVGGTATMKFAKKRFLI